ncbi:LamG domain-containing protein [Candidatus Nanohalococcus occultus]|uniref:LamG domain-containing protein n=1 Tax=Candidatus Nanohalococcus occultus TaxID=2978047 RepID=A0ABY8CF39_9ARCH|nr:LamG domain-containing protein [Candidatus Nanohaloarchaeota archaeon SVXNc]
MDKISFSLRKTELATVLVVLLVLAAGVALASESFLTSGSESELVAEYRFDKGAGDSVRNYAGGGDIMVDGASWTEGLEGKALSFDGSDDNLDLTGNNLRLEPNTTVSVWVNSEDLGSPGHEMSPGLFSANAAGSWDGYVTFADQGNGMAQLRYEDNSGSQKRSDNFRFNKNGWIHVAIAMDGNGKPYFYIDGENVGTDSASGNIDLNYLGVGYNGASDNGALKGEIDKLKIYSRNLSISEIRTLYNRGSWSMGGSDSINYAFSEGFENYGAGSSIDGENGWSYSSECQSRTCEIAGRGESGAKGFLQEGSGDLYPDGMIKTFDKPLRGEITVEGEYWEKSVPNYDGNFWVQACDGTNLAGIGTENPEFEADVLGSEAYLNNPGAAYEQWTHVKMDLDTRTGQVNFSWSQDNSGASDTYSDNFGTGYSICKFGVGPGNRWYIDDISIEQKSSKVMDIGFDEKNTTHVYDTSGKENHGLPSGAVQEYANSCRNGRCYSFEGSDDYIDLPETADLAQNDDSFTASAWINVPESCSTSGGIFGYGNWGSGNNVNAFRTSNDCSDIRHYFWSNDLSTSGLQVNDGDWHHVAVWYNGTHRRILVDGVIEAKDMPGSVDMSVQDVNLGVTNNNEYFNGRIDDFKFFDRALTHSEIIETAGIESQGAVVDMRFDSGGGDRVVDLSGNGFHGVITGSSSAPKWAEGISGNALNFDGSDRYIDLGSDVVPKTSYTKSVWVKTTDSSAGNVVSGDNGQHVLYLNGGDIEVSNTWGSSVFSAKADFHDGSWHNIVVTYDGSTGKVYMDGELLNSGALQDVPSNSKTYIGRYNAGNYFTGKIDEVKILPFALGQNRIKEAYSNRKSVVGANAQKDLEKGLVIDQNFDNIETCGQEDTVTCPSGMTGEIAIDESGNTNHGELIDTTVEQKASRCLKGGCAGFDGSGDHIEVSDSSSLDLSDEATFSSWVKLDSYGTSSGNILAKGGNNAYRMRIETDGEAWLLVAENNTIIRGGDVPLGEWTHVVGRVNSGQNLSLFLNGKQVASKSVAEGLLANNELLYIGSQPNYDEHLDGKIDEFKIYNRSLSDKEIWSLYTDERDRSVSMPGPVASYRFDAAPRVCILDQGSFGDGGWQGPSATSLKNTLDSEGWRTRYVQVGDITQDGWRSCEIIVFPDGERYPAFDKSEDFCNAVNGEGSEHDVYSEMKEFMSDGGLWVGTWGAGLWKPKAWDGDSWESYQNSCSQYSGDGLYSRGGQERCSDLGYSCWSSTSYDYSVNNSVLPAAPGTISSTSQNYRWANGFDVNVLQAYNSTSGDTSDSKFVGIESVGRGYYFHPGSNAVFTPSDYPNADEAWNNLLTWYSGDGKQRFWDSVEQNNGEIPNMGDPVYQLQDSRSSLKFDGENDVIEVPHQDSLRVSNTGEFTITGHIRLQDTSVENWKRVLEKGGYSTGGYSVQRGNPADNPENDKILKFYFADPDGWENRIIIANASDNALDEWHSFTVTIEDGTVTTYFDGQKTNQETGWAYTPTDIPLWIGAANSDGTNSLQGSLDSLKFYPVALTPQQVRNDALTDGVRAGG